MEKVSRTSSTNHAEVVVVVVGGGVNTSPEDVKKEYSRPRSIKLDSDRRWGGGGGGACCQRKMDTSSIIRPNNEILK